MPQTKIFSAISNGCETHWTLPPSCLLSIAAGHRVEIVGTSKASLETRQERGEALRIHFDGFFHQMFGGSLDIMAWTCLIFNITLGQDMSRRFLVFFWYFCGAIMFSLGQEFQHQTMAQVTLFISWKISQSG